MPKNLTIKSIQSADITANMLDHFERKQETRNVHVQTNGNLINKEDAFEDDWTNEDKRNIVAHFDTVLNDGGAVIVAEQSGMVVGFAVIEGNLFGSRDTYLELSFIHVTRQMRGKGIGEMLMEKVRDEAKRLGASKLYIGAHPNVATQSFYRKIGCVLAEEVNQEIYDREPRDIQLELLL
ncbi:GNAT family N-acetyltransferase [Thalassobacillus hwangdonensis]|uniref:GNAT family N-acetyltransferase n=1 Tax=Thalassobacillus hwangdonensis TaxID=546108 RepID=A0ABW3L4N7_9BACI